ncbi:peptidyl-prolyl cis-trans isomerase [Flavobacteriaceae bacterium]|nr:peptidyl-prolyl cis-trans isomerase [Flavobacteriaceae bacterium]MDA8904561.1 peptidyl-prolyl cis-trans isomerase [Flavobacteriaceae bacterium]
MRYILLFFLFFSCDNYFKNQSNIDVARVEDEYLTQNQIEGIFENSTNFADSTMVLNNYINNWAANKLLIQRALVNLTEENQNRIQGLVDDYKRDLLINSYIDALVNENMNLEVTSYALDSLYDNYKETFKLTEDLFKIRFIYVSNLNPDISLFKKKLRRFNTDDARYLDSLSFQFNRFSLNDSIWKNKNEVFYQLPNLKKLNKYMLKKPNFIEIKDSLGLYLINIKDVLKANQYAPLEYVSETLKRMVINKRKLVFIDQLRKDITKDAIKNKSFEIY